MKSISLSVWLALYKFHENKGTMQLGAKWRLWDTWRRLRVLLFLITSYALKNYATHSLGISSQLLDIVAAY